MQRELLEQHRVALLHDLDRRGFRDADGRTAVGDAVAGRAAAVAAAGDHVHHVGAPGLRIDAADGQVAAGPGRRGEQLRRNRPGQRREHRLGDALADLRRAARHRARIARVEKGTVRVNDAQRLEGTGVERHVREHMLDREVDRRARGGDDAVHRAAAGRRRAAHVEGQRGIVDSTGLGDLHRDAQGLVDHAVGIDERFTFIDAVGDSGDARAHLLCRALAQFGDRRGHARLAVAPDQRAQALFAGHQRRGLRLDVADALVGDADVRADDREDLVVDLAALVQLDRRQAQPLLLDLDRVGRKPARDHAAGVGPVAGVGQPAPQAAVVEKRLDELHVHQVGAAKIGVVEDEHVARVQRDRVALDPLDHRSHRELHGADEHRQSQLALRDQRAILCGVDAVRAVKRLGNHRRERRAHERQIHLVADLVEAVLDHGEGDGVEHLDVRSG